MDKNSKAALLVFLLIIGLFALLASNPYKNKQPELQGSFVQQPEVQQPVLVQEKTISKSTLSGNIDLNDWKPEEIAAAIAKYNTRLDPKPYNYEYNEDCSFYAQYGELFGKDPFCNILHYPYGQEWNDGHLRIYHLDYDVKEPADVKYQEYLDDVLKETQLDEGLYCYTQEECNDIKVIVCTKDNNNYFSWFQGQVLMTSVNDARRNLNAFARFYCSTELKPLTGSLISGLSDELIIDKIADFIKKLS